MDAPQSSALPVSERRARRRIPDGPILTFSAWGVAMIGAVLASIAGAVVFAVLAVLRGEAIGEAAQSPGAT